MIYRIVDKNYKVLGYFESKATLAGRWVKIFTGPNWKYKLWALVTYEGSVAISTKYQGKAAIKRLLNYNG